MTAADLDAVARLHIDAFPDFFLSSLGPKALRVLYDGMLKDATGIALVAAGGGNVIGVAAGSMNASGFYSRLVMRRWWIFAALLASRVLRRPSLLPALLWRVRSATSFHAPGEATLLSLAVMPAAQHRGAGAALVQQFVETAKMRGARAVNLTTDAVDNESVIRFYERLGFHRRETLVTRERRQLHEYVCDL